MVDIRDDKIGDFPGFQRAAERPETQCAGGVAGCAGQRLSHRSRNLLAGGPARSAGRTLFESACRGGAQALGLKIGKIAPGCHADFLRLDDEVPALAGKRSDDLLDAWIFAGSPTTSIRDVWVGDRQVVESGRHVRAGEFSARYRQCLRRLLEQ